MNPITSFSGKLVGKFQMDINGYLDTFLINKNDDTIISANRISNGYTSSNLIEFKWDLDANKEDILIEERKYPFYENNGEIILIDSNEVTYDLINNLFVELPISNINNFRLETRLIKYKRHSSLNIPKIYKGWYAIEYNHEMLVYEDTKGDYFKRWRNQNKCKILVKEYPNNPQHPKHKEWLMSTHNNLGYGSLGLEWFIEETEWTIYQNQYVYY